MSAEAAAPAASNRLIRSFVESVVEEVGADNLPLVLAKIDLPASAIWKEALDQLDGPHAAQLYAKIQQSLRLFYTRRARGLLLRIGRRLWERMVAQANLREKAELEIARRLPVPARRRRVLELLAERLREGGGSARVQLVGIDLLLVDHASAATSGQSSARPICFVSLGLVQGALLWATGQEANVEEISCKASGAASCEFKITFGGK